MSSAMTGRSKEAKQLVKELAVVIGRQYGEIHGLEEEDNLQSLVLYANAKGSKPEIELKVHYFRTVSYYEGHYRYHKVLPLERVKEMLKDLGELFSRWTGTGGGEQLFALRLHLDGEDAVTWDAQLCALVPEENCRELYADCLHKTEDPSAMQGSGCGLGYVHCKSGDKTCLGYEARGSLWWKRKPLPQPPPAPPNRDVNTLATTSPQRCEICGGTVVQTVRDVKEVPSKDGESRWFEPDSDWHYRCARHPYRSVTRWLDGSVSDDGIKVRPPEEGYRWSEPAICGYVEKEAEKETSRDGNANGS